MIDSLRRDVRAAFDSRYVASPGLADRVLRGLDQAPRGRGFDWRPAIAGVLGLTTIAVLAWPFLRDSALLAGTVPPPPALSLGAVTADGQLWVVERDFQRAPGPARQTHNALFVRDASGWHQRLAFDGVFDKLTAAGREATLVTTIQSFGACSAVGAPDVPACQPPDIEVYRTSDGGAHWQHARLPVTIALPAGETEVQFATPSAGWAAIATGASLFAPRDLYATTDAGATWSRVGPLPSPAPPQGARSFIPGVTLQLDPATRRGFLAANWPAPSGHSGLWVTADGGASWNEVALARPAGLEGASMNLVQPRILASEILVPVAFRPAQPDNAAPNDLYVYDVRAGAAADGPRPVFAGGEKLRPVGDVVTMDVLDAQHWWVTSQSPTAGDGVQARPAVAATADGGAHWTFHQPAPRILFMSFQSAEHGYALAVEGPGNTNVILETSDAGAHWTHVGLPAFPAGS